MVRMNGWREGADVMQFITIVREFTGRSLDEAKEYCDRVRNGETIVLSTNLTDQSKAFAARLLDSHIVNHADVIRDIQFQEDSF